MKLVVQELVVHAPAARVYEMLTDPELFVQWMAEDAVLNPVPGSFGDSVAVDPGRARS